MQLVAPIASTAIRKGNDMKHRIILAALALLMGAAIPQVVSAQQAIVIPSCGSVTLTAGQQRPVYQDVNGNQCTASSGGSGSTNATIVAPLGSQLSAAGVAVTIASDQAAVAVKNSGTFAVQNTTATPAGSNTIGAVNQGVAAAVSAGWPVINGEPADTTGTFTNGTQTGNVTSATVDGYETATITISGTYGTATATFLASDDSGTTFYPIQCARSDGSAVEIGYTTLTNTNRAWYCPIHGFDSVRVLSSAVASGTVNVRISISSSPTAGGVAQTVTQSVASGLNAQVVGDSASGATDSGAKPVKVGGVYNSTAPVLTTGQRGDSQLGADGSVIIAGRGTSAVATGFNGSTVLMSTAAGNSRPLGVTQYQYNGSTMDWDRTIQGADGTGVGVTATAASPNSNTNAAISSTTPAGNGVALNASSLIACSAACNGYTVEVVSLSSAGFVMVFNATTAPADGAVTPDTCRPLAATTGIKLDLGEAEIPERFATGLTVVFSTGANCRTKTAASADLIKVLAK